MKRIPAIIVLSLCLTACSAQTPQTTTPADKPSVGDAALTFDLVMPQDVQRTSSGMAYAAVEKGGDVSPTEIQALRIRLKAYDVKTGDVEEVTAIETIPQFPYFGEILARMHFGDTYRVWGESEGRVWDITLVEVAHEFDPPEDLTPPEDAEELNGARWVLLEAGEGEKIAHGQAIRFHATRWDAKTGTVLESSIAGEGMLAILNNDMFYHDPVHAALFMELSPKAKARLWLNLPKKEKIPSEDTPDDRTFDILEEITIVERMPQYDMPPDLRVPEDATLVAEGAWLKIISTAAPDLVPLKTGEDVLVDMTCWNSDNGGIIMSSALSKEPTRMVLSEDLGIWHDLMLHAAHGMTFRTWTTPDAMPENVVMPMTCRVTVE